MWGSLTIPECMAGRGKTLSPLEKPVLLGKNAFPNRFLECVGESPTGSIGPP